ncbi:MAG TPA: nitroreductase [Clostridiales bacterium]|nr:nitroreductase [Clostridiales bacterium]
MIFLDVAKERYSVRSYEKKEVEREKLLQVLEAARIAPSAVNFQPVHLIVVTEQEEKEKIYQTYKRDWIKEAPVVIVACGDHKVSWDRKDGKDHCDIDVAIAVDHMTLAAVEQGLGTCWVCAFDAKLCHELLGLPENLEVVALLPLGYPKGERTTEPRRKKLEELVSWERY